MCSPRLGVRRPEDLAGTTLIHFEWRRAARGNPTWPRWLEQAGLAGLRPASELILTDESQAIQAAVAGHGVALLSLLLVSEEIARGTLVQPFGPSLEGYGYFLVYPEASEESERVAALRRWIRGELGMPAGEP